MTRRRVSMVAAVFTATFFSAVPAEADIVGFNNGANFTVNGGATIVGGTLTLTDSNVFEARSAFYDTPQSISGDWVASFDYQATQPGAFCFCDGSAFILQNAPGGQNAVGSSGGGYGYGGISPSAAIEFSPNGTFSPGGPGTNFYTNGNTPQSGGPPLMSTAPVDISSQDKIEVSISYTGGDLMESLTDLTTSATFSHDYGLVDLSAIVGGTTAFIGFSGATGGGTSTQTISDFSFTPVEPTPEPASLVLLATGIGCCVWFRRRRDNIV